MWHFSVGLINAAWRDENYPSASTYCYLHGAWSHLPFLLWHCTESLCSFAFPLWHLNLSQSKFFADHFPMQRIWTSFSICICMTSHVLKHVLFRKTQVYSVLWLTQFQLCSSSAQLCTYEQFLQLLTFVSPNVKTFKAIMSMQRLARDKQLILSNPHLPLEFLRS